MKLSFLLLFSFLSLTLVGCGSRIQSGVDTLIQKDTEHQQGNNSQLKTELTSQDVVKRVQVGSGLLDLSGLDLDQIPNICDLLPLEYLSQIVSVDLSNNNLTSVDTDLSCLPGLESLKLSKNQISEILGLGDVDSLISLYLDSNNLSSLKDLPVLENLKELSLKYNKLKDLSGIDLFKELVGLNIENNMLEDLIGIENLPNLSTLEAKYNELSKSASSLLETLRESGILQ